MPFFTDGFPQPRSGELICPNDAIESLSAGYPVDGKALAGSGSGCLAVWNQLPCRRWVEVVPIFQLIVPIDLAGPGNPDLGGVSWIEANFRNYNGAYHEHRE